MSDFGDNSCESCDESEWSAEGSRVCSDCPEGTETVSGPGTSESDCKLIACPSSQYKNEDGDCVDCAENEWSAEGDNECSTCPEGTETESGPGTSESDCTPSSAKSARAIYAPILVMLGVLAFYFC